MLKKKNHAQQHLKMTNTCKVCCQWAKHKEKAGVAKTWYVNKERERSPKEYYLLCGYEKKLNASSHSWHYELCLYSKLSPISHEFCFAPLGGTKSPVDPVIKLYGTDGVGCNAEDIASIPMVI